jgi:hypothetical protein
MPGTPLPHGRRCDPPPYTPWKKIVVSTSTAPYAIYNNIDSINFFY